MPAIYFRSPSEFRAWLEKHHATDAELLVGFHKKHTGKPSMTWPESVDEALCYGWIDGVRKGVDDDRYTIRFTPRKPTSIWSAINIRNVERLEKAGRMRPSGRAAFDARSDKKSAIYSYEQRHHAEFPPEQEQRFRANAKAWGFFESQPPGYRKVARHWVTSAKQQATRERRFEELVARSAEGLRPRQLIPPGKPAQRGRSARK